MFHLIVITVDVLGYAREKTRRSEVALDNTAIEAVAKPFRPDVIKLC